MKRISTLSIIYLLSTQLVSAQCDPAFSTSINAGTAVFTGQNTDPGKFHSWAFGDGQYGYGNPLTHTYTASGTYNVKHWVIDTLGACSDSLVQSIQVTVINDCHSSFVINPDSLSGSTRHFVSNSTSGTGTIISYLWTINGNYAGGGSTHSQSFSPGTYNVCLTIVTTNGCSSTSCQSVIINTPPPCNLSADFTYTPSSANPQSISFSPVPASTLYTYLWLFGDGQFTSQVSPVHLYNYPGTYQVKMVLQDSLSGCRDTVNKTITVSPGPAYNCTASFTYSVSNNWLASFTAASNQTISQAQWYIYDAPDSVILNGVNTTYQFSDTGRYNVCLVITTVNGCVASSCQEVVVYGGSGRYTEYIPAYPNPVSNGELSLDVETPQRDKIKIRIMDIAGNTVYHTEKESLPGINKVKIPVDQLGRGQYFIEVCIRYKIKRSIFQKL